MYKYTFYNDFYKDSNLKNLSSNESLLEYLRGFDAIDKKYRIVPDQNFDPDILQALLQYEESFQLGNLVKQEYSFIEENLRLVYGDSHLVHNGIVLYHLTEKKIIHQYLGIPGLEKMFDEDYFNFEWDMHVGQNFNEHRNDYTRDHFLHQIRDMYMMLVLLDKFKFYDATSKIMKNKDCGKAPEYASKMLRQYLDNLKPTVANLFGKMKPANYSVEKFAEEYFMNYVIYASSMLSALFHDMGYPICHFLEIRHRISAYNPTMYMFTHNAVDSFDQLASKLGDSLLFTIVSSDEIKRRLQVNDKGKYNHGAYSAIAFLLQFYNTGLIHSLSEEKRCAIEIAAVAIYNHTAKFNCIKYDKNNNYFQPVFRQNPIAFMLRLCDDLQEWDRRYFEISSDSDLSICSKCLMPTLLSIENETDAYNRQRKDYKCKCEVNSKCKTTSFRYDSFLRRKIYVVTMADRVSFIDYDERDPKQLCVQIDYDLYRLLKMARINHTYAEYRLKELKELKCLLKNQNFNEQSEGELPFIHIYLNYFMTANPITIKVKILEKYLQGGIGNKVMKPSDIATLDLDKVFTKLKLPKTSALYTYLNNGVFDFYKKLLKLAVECRDICNSEKNCGNKRYFIKKGIMRRTLFNNAVKDFFENNEPLSRSLDAFYNDTIKILIEDCLEQYSKEPVPKQSITEEFLKSDKYYDQYETSKTYKDLVNNCIARYCDKENVFNKYYEDDSGKYIGYYADLFFFSEMNKQL